MAALVYFICSTIEQICVVTNAFVNKGYSFRQSLVYLQKQQQLNLFKSYCRELWHIDELRKFKVRNNSANKKTIQLQNMKRAGIDFAAIEAFGTLDNITDNPNANKIDAAYRFLEIERLSHNETASNDSNYNDIEIISGDEVDNTFYEYIDTLPVYINENIGPLKEGVSFTVTGQILMNCERFSINFIISNEPRDIALHINPRLPQNYIVRNTKAYNTWGVEEVTSPQPFSLHRGKKFSIQVLVTDACYMISVNGNHFAEYAHRLPYSLVNSLEVRGDVDNIDMHRLVVSEYPARLHQVTLKQIRVQTDSTKTSQRTENCICTSNESCDTTDTSNFSMPQSWRLIPSPSVRSDSRSAPKIDKTGLSLPYYGIMPAKSLTAGRCLIIEGRVKLLPHSFYINLQSGQHIWPHPIIAFHLNPRFSKKTIGAIGKAVVCRNAWYDGAWADEERSELDTNLLPGKPFYIIILCTDVAFEVYVNRKLITSFKYRVLPDIVDTVYIQGDIKLWNVALQHHYSNTNEDPSQLAIYKNYEYMAADNEE